MVILAKIYSIIMWILYLKMQECNKLYELRSNEAWNIKVIKGQLVVLNEMVQNGMAGFALDRMTKITQ